MRARVVYDVPGLSETEAAPDPLSQFRRWFADAAAAGISEPNAMTLTTAGLHGPNARVVLAKTVDRRGISFFTNLRSDKAREIEHDPRAAALFAWIPLHRQIRFRGTASVLPRSEAEEYFADRPRGAQIGAWASPQSQPLASRDELARRVAEIERRFPGEIPLPDFWGCFRLTCTDVEFWQGQPSRLHDRLRYDRRRPDALLDDPSGWQLVRLAP
jgi:pyridoxamine 5'-phosphate oxidase